MKVLKLGLERHPDYLIYVAKNGDIWRAHKTSGKKNLVTRVGDKYKKEKGYLYYLDADGDIARSKAQ